MKKQAGKSKKKGLLHHMENMARMPKILIYITLTSSLLASVLLLSLYIVGAVRGEPLYPSLIIESGEEGVKAVLLSLTIGFSASFLLDYSQKTEQK